MSTETVTLRSGLPRIPGGDGWPPEGTTVDTDAGFAQVGGGAAVANAAVDAAAVTQDSIAEAPVTEVVPAEAVAASAVAEPAPAASVAAPVADPATQRTPIDVALRRGLPRVPGGEGWPPADAVAMAAAPITNSASVAPAAAAPAAAAIAPAAVAVSAPSASPQRTVTEEVALRRGLPRVPGGEPWPEVSTASVETAVEEQVAEQGAALTAVPPTAAPPIASPPTAVPPAAVAVGGAVAGAAATGAAATAAATTQAKAQKPKPAQKSAKPAAAQQDSKEPSKYKRFIPWGIAALVALVAAVLAARGWVGSDSGAEFIAKYDGVAPTPDSTPVGLPAWLGWSHFFNMFLMVMIIRTGLQIRNERKPEAYFTPKKDPSKKVSLTIWFHTSLDLLWLLNGAIFIILLFVTGQWMRIVPTSWDIFPNMVSAAVQYLSLDWPAENGWIHYNALQQMAYFITVFIAAPLAAATGFRMSNWWPKDNKALSNAYPVEVARKVHFPVMLYFVLFIIGHVFLVFATGAKKNLGHMFAASPDGGWLGVGLFALAVAVIIAAVYAARPMLLAPIARLFGNVTNR